MIKKVPAYPPEIPDVKRRFRLHKYQYIGLPLLFILPLLSLLGMFGQTMHSKEKSEGGLRVRVEYPSRTRFSVDGKIDVEVQNTSNAPLEQVQVRIDRAYLRHFDEVIFTPEVVNVVDNYYQIDLPTLAPGETQHVIVAMKANNYGQRRGSVTAAVGETTLKIALNTFTLP